VRTIQDEIEILEMCLPVYNDAGGIWFRNNHNMADGNFKDWGAARAFARAATELPRLVKALESCAEAKMPGEARRIAREALGSAVGGSGKP
jgi:hypothetical protein